MKTVRKPYIVSVKENFMLFSTLGDISFISYTQKITNSKKYKSTTNQFILSILEASRSTHKCKNQKLDLALQSADGNEGTMFWLGQRGGTEFQILVEESEREGKMF